MRLIRLPVVESKTGLRKSSIYEAIKTAEFPEPVKLSERASAWVEGEVDKWIERRIEERDRSRRAASSQGGAI